MYRTIKEEAWQLVHSLATASSSPDGFGTMSPAVYDTAWVAMTEKNGEPLFPEACEYLRKTQSKDGSWAAETSKTDGIINTLAALLALKKQIVFSDAAREDNERRCNAAESVLQKMLNSWDLQATDRVGMEVLVPNLLHLLEAEGVFFDFSCREALMKLNAAKLAKLGPILTSPVQTTLIHTLEAFVGNLDFDRVKQHRMPNGSMLASPSSTAAYLMNASKWDDEAETYLRTVFTHHAAMGNKGGFPSAYPSNIFETTWVLDILFEAGFQREDFLLDDIRKLTVLVETNLEKNKGVIGWAPSCLPDADDTAKAVSVLRLLGWNKDVEPMLSAFEADDSFITYQGERNPSPSANCNILSCLLQTYNPAKHTRQIVKCIDFLGRTWMRNNGPDKWHTSVQYPMMLIAQSFILFLKRWGKSELDMEAVPKKLVSQVIPRTLLDILSKTMRSQCEDGSWDSKREVTAYAVLTLAALLSLPWVDFLKPAGMASMYRGKAYLETNRQQWDIAEKVWIEKVVYSSKHLSKAYCLAASNMDGPLISLPHKVADIFPVELSKKMDKMAGFFARVEPFSQAPKWQLQLSLLQSAQYGAALKASKHDIFPSLAKANDEKYQEYIPFTWVGCKNFLSTPMSAETLWEMMLVSMFNFQVDAFMETDVWDEFKDRLPELKAFVRELCSPTPRKRKRSLNGSSEEIPNKVSKPDGVCIQGSEGASDGSSNGISNEKLKDMKYGNITTTDASPKDAKTDKITSNGTNELASVDAPNHSMVPNGVNGHATSVKLTNGSGTSTKERSSEVKQTLVKFVNFALQHPKVTRSPPSLQAWLALELQTFLLAHVTHMEDCVELSKADDTSNGSLTWTHPRTTFFNWVRTTSADHTSCPYSFVFFLCLISEADQRIVLNLEHRYALEDACRHLATSCRQYNDFGSVVRDSEEKNLNSVNFPEFVSRKSDPKLKTDELNERKKADLLALARYERRCLDRVVGDLEQMLDPRVMEQLKLFIQVTDLYGHIYVARDIGIRHVEGSAAKPGVV